eukprot:m.445328 g.445328  ORF g.445328 m.445328 type:complete len:343 (+) comp19214_c0_seq1:982-2010(+)
MLSTASGPVAKSGLQTPNRGTVPKVKVGEASAMPSVVIGTEAYSVFGENGDSIIQDLMRTDDHIMNQIMSESNSSMEHLLGSVFSPAQVAGLASPHVSSVLMSPRGGGGVTSSPRDSPRNFYSLAWSPHPPTSDSVRRSARITPTRGIFLNMRDEAGMDLDIATPRAFGPHDQSSKRKTPSSRKALQMEGSAAMAKSNYQDFEDYVLPPLSPFTPYESTDRDISQAGKAKANLSFTTEKKTKVSASKSSKKDSAGSKRGEYKCGKCGFFPKKEKHDCTAYKKKCIQQGIEIQTRNRKGSGGSKKKPKSKVAKVMGHRPILTTVQANQAMMETLEPVGVLPMS